MKNEKMNVLMLSVALALSGWTLKEVVSLKVQVAELSVRVAALSPIKTPQIANYEKQNQ
jgi:hypothetical protein